MTACLNQSCLTLDTLFAAGPPIELKTHGFQRDSSVAFVNEHLGSDLQRPRGLSFGGRLEPTGGDFHLPTSSGAYLGEQLLKNPPGSAVHSDSDLAANTVQAAVTLASSSGSRE